MKILLTNDDGIFAPGLAALYKELINIGQVTVVAPSDSRSGASHSITFTEPLVCNKVDINGLFTGYSVQGSPADCVKLAAMQLHPEPIDLLVAGINNGANAGINVYYSGTVAAAMEGAGEMINVNIPLLSRGQPKGIRIVPQSSKGFDEYYIPKKNEQGQTVFQLAGEHHLADEIPSDTTSLTEGYITITALAPDMTDHRKTQKLRNKKW